MKVGRAIFFAVALAALACPGGCARLALARVALNEGRPAASPPVLGAFGSAPSLTTIEAWEEGRAPALREAFQRSIYGYFPDESRTQILEHRVVDPAAFGGAGVIEEYKLRVSATFDDEAADTEEFWIDVVLPVNRSRPAPVLMMQTFCPRSEMMERPAVSSGGPGVSCNGGFLSAALKLFFKRYVKVPPTEELLARGYGLATLYPSQVVPDRPRAGLDALDALAPKRAESDTRWGAIAAWAWLYSRMVDVLEKDARIDQEALVALGHSRYGKAALVAAAFDRRIDGVIANQSGTGGSALNRNKRGETIRQITKDYPHWFATAYDNYAGREDDLPVDQHQLIALIAPRPVLLGNARRDVWADPAGAFQAGRGADPVYELYGLKGLDQASLKDFNPKADIALWMRSGIHGVLNRDWAAFLAFIEAHFASNEAAAKAETAELTGVN